MRYRLRTKRGPAVQGQKGFTLIELIITMMVFVAAGIGIQLFILSSMTTLNIQKQAEAAEDIVDGVANQVGKRSDAFDYLNNHIVDNLTEPSAKKAARQSVLSSADKAKKVTLYEDGAMIDNNALINNLINTAERATITSMIKSLGRDDVTVDLYAQPVVKYDDANEFSESRVRIEVRLTWQSNRVAPVGEVAKPRIKSAFKMVSGSYNVLPSAN